MKKEIIHVVSFRNKRYASISEIINLIEKSQQANVQNEYMLVADLLEMFNHLNRIPLTNSKDLI